MYRNLIRKNSKQYMLKEYSEEKFLYVLGLILIFAFILFLLVLNFLNINIFDFNVSCLVYEKTGYYCPGCGATRAIKALLRGNVLDSIKYHPLVCYIVVIYGLFMILNTISLVVKRDFSGMKVHNFLLFLIPIILLFEWVIKNILLFFWNIRIM